MISGRPAIRIRMMECMSLNINYQYDSLSGSGNLSEPDCFCINFIRYAFDK